MGHCRRLVFRRRAVRDRHCASQQGCPARSPSTSVSSLLPAFYGYNSSGRHYIRVDNHSSLHSIISLPTSCSSSSSVRSTSPKAAILPDQDNNHLSIAPLSLREELCQFNRSSRFASGVVNNASGSYSHTATYFKESSLVVGPHGVRGYTHSVTTYQRSPISRRGHPAIGPPKQWARLSSLPANTDSTLVVVGTSASNPISGRSSRPKRGKSRAAGI